MSSFHLSFNVPKMPNSLRLNALFTVLFIDAEIPANKKWNDFEWVTNIIFLNYKAIMYNSTYKCSHM
jgi:hypothetical protein